MIQIFISKAKNSSIINIYINNHEILKKMINNIISYENKVNLYNFLLFVNDEL